MDEVMEKETEAYAMDEGGDMEEETNPTNSITSPKKGKATSTFTKKRRKTMQKVSRAKHKVARHHHQAGAVRYRYYRR
jgi:hypothetical protein